MPKRYPPEFRRKVLDLVASGRRVAQVAADLDINEQTIYVWRRQQLINTGQLPGITSTDQAELVAARRRIAELEAEVEITAAPRSCSRRWSSQKALRGRAAPCRGCVAGS
jgi:transposase-like protein